MATSLFHGLSAFPITPADARGHVNIDALSGLLDHLVTANVDSIGLLGSTGTYAYLTRAERQRAIGAAASCIGGRTPLIVGIGALRTDDTQDLARDAEAAGADGLLLAPVSYTPLTDDEVLRHFVTVAETTNLPLCVYNNPGTTHFTFSDALVERLASVPNVVAVKNPSPAPGEAQGKHEALSSRVPRTFAIGYSGDWHASYAVLAGGVAWYSVVGGLLPIPTLKIMRAAQAGDRGEVERWNTRFQPLWELFKAFSSLRVVYAAAGILDICHAEPPRPILPLPSSIQQRLAAALDVLKEDGQ